MPSRSVVYDPQLATLVSKPPRGPQWIHELKWDGYRIGAVVEAGKVRLWSRRGSEWTGQLPEIAAAVSELGLQDVILDGEVVVLRPDGTSSFQDLQNVFGRGAQRAGLSFMLFDLLELNGRNLRFLPLDERKRELKNLLDKAGSRTLLYSQDFEADGDEVFANACRLRAEGIVSKRRDRPYRSGRSPYWLKTKCELRQEFVVGGFTDPSGSRRGLGSLMLGVRGADGALKFAGKVSTGVGVNAAFLDKVRKALAPTESRVCPFKPRPPGWLGRNAHWVEPRLVVEVGFAQWTAGGHVRHPRLLGLRPDKRPGEIVREEPQELSGGESVAPGEKKRRRAGASQRAVRDAVEAPTRRRAGASARAEDAPVVAGVLITHPHRVVYPDLGFTKGDLARFYAQIGDWALPHLSSRPLTLVRCEQPLSKPDALRSQCAFLHHTAAANARISDSVPRVKIHEQKKTGEYVVIDSLHALMSLVQANVIELHSWNARAADFEHPDRVVFDLDPAPGVAWPKVVDTAKRVRRKLEKLGLESWVKATGGKGLHVVVPFKPEHEWDDVYAFSREFAVALARERSELTTAFEKAERAGRILLDYKRNHRTATAISAYSTRARPGGAVSVPLAWEELTARSAPDRFTVRNLGERLRRLKADPWAGYFRSRQRLLR